MNPWNSELEMDQSSSLLELFPNQDLDIEDFKTCVQKESSSNLQVMFSGDDPQLAS